MLSRETLEAYRRMTPGQRLEIALEMMVWLVDLPSSI